MTKAVSDMATLYRDEVVKTALAQVGKACGKTNPYSKELDSVNFYNTKKNGVADSCSIFVDWCVYTNTSPKTAVNGRAMVYEPNVDNCGAGCAQAVQYFKDHKAWVASPKNFKLGDKYFLKSNAKKSKINPLGVYHTGTVVEITSDGFKGVEGNTNGGKVAKKSYKFTDSKLAGAGRPKFTADKKPTPTPEPTPTPTPAPAPKPTPTTQKYKVKTNTGAPLALRSAPKTKAVCLAWIPNKTTVNVSGFVTGEKVGGCDQWARVTYNGKNGYSLSKYLVKS